MISAPRPCAGGFVLQADARSMRQRRNQEIAGAGARRRSADATLEPHAVAGKKPQRLGVDVVLHFEDALGERLRDIMIAEKELVLTFLLHCCQSAAF